MPMPDESPGRSGETSIRSMKPAAIDDKRWARIAQLSARPTDTLFDLLLDDRLAPDARNDLMDILASRNVDEAAAREQLRLLKNEAKAREDRRNFFWGDFAAIGLLLQCAVVAAVVYGMAVGVWAMFTVVYHRSPLVPVLVATSLLALAFVSFAWWWPPRKHRARAMRGQGSCDARVATTMGDEEIVCALARMPLEPVAGNTLRQVLAGRGFSAQEVDLLVEQVRKNDACTEPTPYEEARRAWPVLDWRTWAGLAFLGLLLCVGNNHPGSAIALMAAAIALLSPNRSIREAMSFPWMLLRVVRRG